MLDGIQVVLLHNFGDDLRFSGLKQVLLSYRGELAKSQSSAPYILSRMSIEISTIVRKDKLILTLLMMIFIKEAGQCLQN